MTTDVTTQEGDALAEGVRQVRLSKLDPIIKPPPKCGRATSIVRRTTTLALCPKNVLRDIAGSVAHGDWKQARRMALTATHPTELTAPKVVSPRYRCVWFSCTKVASRSILSVLVGTDPDCKVYQLTAADLYRRLPNARKWFSFAFVRHPFHRALSCWFDLHVALRHYSDRIDIQTRKRDHLFSRYHGLADTQEFDAYCEWLNTPYGADKCADVHFMSLDPQLRDDHGRLPNFIGRFEDLREDWLRVAMRLNIPVPKLPLLHSGVGWEAAPEDVRAMRSSRAALLTARNRALLAKRYAKDMKLGGYDRRPAAGATA